MNKSLIKDRNRQSLTIKKKSSVLLLSLVACFPYGSNWASTIELDNNNFRQYLNADHPIKGHYQLISNVDLSQYDWTPVGNLSTPFSLTLHGNGYIISGLNVSTSAHGTATGLFGSLQKSTIRQVLLNRPTVASAGNTSPTGALAGELKDSRIEEVVNYAGTVKTKGFHSHGGGLAGSVADSVIHNSVNTGRVITTLGSNTGGIAGLADQASSVSNDLNTGRIISKLSYSLSTGGIVGTLKSRSVANNNMNTGKVITSHGEHAGGIAGEANAAKILNNLNTGRISGKRGGDRGGIVGRASSQTLVSKNLNAGNILTENERTHAGGIAGQAVNSPVVQNVNAGTVHIDGSGSFAGGIAGSIKGGSTHNNLNAGAITSKVGDDNRGGISGSADRAPVYDNVNTGSVETIGYRGYTSGAVAKISEAGRIENNLDTFTKDLQVSGPGNGRNIGITRLTKTVLKSNLSGLDSALWNAGDASQLPMLRGINIPYRELARISGTNQANNRFPRALNEFADPGGASNATSFNRGIWSGRDGYLPFPKAFSKPQTLVAGIYCTQGGFDCSDEKDIRTNPSAKPSSSSERSSTSELATGSKPTTSPGSKLTSEVSSTVPSSSAQPSTSELNTASKPTTSAGSKTTSEASSAVPSSSAQPSTSKSTTASKPTTSAGSKTTSEASSAVPSSSAQHSTSKSTTASKPTTSAGSKPTSEASSAVPSSSAQPSTSELNTASKPTTSAGSKPTSEASSAVPSSSAQPSTSKSTTTSKPTASPGLKTTSEASSAVPSSSAQPSTSKSTTASIPTASAGSKTTSEASSAVPSSSIQPSTSESTMAYKTRALPVSESLSATVTQNRLLSSFNDSTDNISSTTHSTSPSDNCPPLKGTPVFQAYDPENQRIYVVIQPESHNKDVILARYNGSELDEQFGLCGIVKYKTSASHSRIMDSYQSLVGQVIHETAGSQLNIVATTYSGKTTLLEFPLSAAREYRGRFTVLNNLFPDNVQINDTAHYKGVMYLTGTVDDQVFIGHYQQQQLFFPEKLPENIEQHYKEQGIDLRLSADGKRLYVTGKSDEDASYPLFIRQYDSIRLNPAAYFGNNGKEIMTTMDIDTINSQPDILMQKDHAYVAVFSHEDEKLSIRRFATENGQMDSAFMIDDRVGFPSRSSDSLTTVSLMTTEDYLHAIIYNSEGQVSVVTYEGQVNINRFDTTFKPAAVKSMRPVFVGNKVYLSVEDYESEKGSRYVRMQEISLHPGNYNHQKKPTVLSFEEPPSSSELSRKSSEELSAEVFAWGIGLISASSVTAVTVAIVIAIKVFKKQPPVSEI
ncbi:hypothetical protein [Endozoicomonas sp. 8E]|uniref:hypothetical protein n=1 Tax=Endozoicomonas sp. 8E TaxID=3035692 RepID=UPI0029392BC4|nr:hypothetical protein [Endozoicomonas sp. 8E]WOG27434.1 hypothetical protein P6910_23250 [Endozoicomonas sp. 8E]